MSDNSPMAYNDNGSGYLWNGNYYVSYKTDDKRKTQRSESVKKDEGIKKNEGIRDAYFEGDQIILKPNSIATESMKIYKICYRCNETILNEINLNEIKKELLTVPTGPIEENLAFQVNLNSWYCSNEIYPYNLQSNANIILSNDFNTKESGDDTADKFDSSQLDTDFQNFNIKESDDNSDGRVSDDKFVSQQSDKDLINIKESGNETADEDNNYQAWYLSNNYVMLPYHCLDNISYQEIMYEWKEADFAIVRVEACVNSLSPLPMGRNPPYISGFVTLTCSNGYKIKKVRKYDPINDHDNGDNSISMVGNSKSNDKFDTNNIQTILLFEVEFEDDLHFGDSGALIKGSFTALTASTTSMVQYKV